MVKFETKTQLKDAGSTILNSVLADQPNLLYAEGLERTPERFEKALHHLTSGYKEDPQTVIGKGVFPAEGQGLVAVREVEFYSLCEHHLLPFWGQASVAYYPNQHILGLSKIPRVIDVFARRFQVQERLTKEIVEAINSSVKPRAVVARVTACHLCMMMRGVEKQKSHTTTEYHLGLQNLDAEERARIWKAVE